MDENIERVGKNIERADEDIGKADQDIERVDKDIFRMDENIERVDKDIERADEDIETEDENITIEIGDRDGSEVMRRVIIVTNKKPRAKLFNFQVIPPSGLLFLLASSISVTSLTISIVSLASREWLVYDVDEQLTITFGLWSIEMVFSQTQQVVRQLLAIEEAPTIWLAARSILVFCSLLSGVVFAWSFYYFRSYNKRRLSISLGMLSLLAGLGLATGLCLLLVHLQKATLLLPGGETRPLPVAPTPLPVTPPPLPVPHLMVTLGYSFYLQASSIGLVFVVSILLCVSAWMTTSTLD